MDLAQHLSRLRGEIDAGLATRLGEWFRGLPPADLEALRAVLARGKRLRGCLACLVAEALGAESEAARPAALAVEIVQAASLVHDDVVDGDALRRGRPAAWTWLTPRRAVLLADLMFATALEKMAESGAREAAALAHAIAATARGACEEVLDPNASYRRVIALKTGALFAAAAHLGALAARAQAPLIEVAHRFGARTGEAYQIADDLADRALDDPVWQQRMDDDIAALIDEARTALAPFPDNERTRMLCEAPAQFVRMLAPA